jgi:hypothetical protein
MAGAEADSGGGVDLNIGQQPTAAYAMGDVGTVPVATAAGRSGYGYGAEISAAGSGLEAFAGLAQGILAAKRARSLANYNAKVAEANAQAQAQAAGIEALQLHRQALLLQQDQLLAHEAQLWREARNQEQHEQVLGQTRAIVARSGILMEGSPLAVYEESLRQMHLDTHAQRYQVQLQQRASGEQASQAEYGATLARYGAGERLRMGTAQAGLLRGDVDDTQVLAGLTRAGGSLLKGAATYSYLKTRGQSTLLG